MTKIEMEEENENGVEECDRSNNILGCYLKDIFNYVRTIEVLNNSLFQLNLNPSSLDKIHS